MRHLPIFISIFMALVSCNRPECHNTNPVFDNYSPDSKEYKAELVKQLKIANTKKLTYWIQSYLRKNDRDYILINIQGDNLCAIGMLHFTDSDKDFTQYKKVQGLSYSSAELAGLKYDIIDDSDRNELEFKSLKLIVD